MLRTAESHSPLDAAAVGASLVVFVVVYFTVFGAGTFYVLRLMSRRLGAGSDPVDTGPMRAAGIVPGPATQLQVPPMPSNSGAARQ